MTSEPWNESSSWTSGPPVMGTKRNGARAGAGTSVSTPRSRRASSAAREFVARTLFSVDVDSAAESVDTWYMESSSPGWTSWPCIVRDCTVALHRSRSCRLRHVVDAQTGHDIVETSQQSASHGSGAPGQFRCVRGCSKRVGGHVAGEQPERFSHGVEEGTQRLRVGRCGRRERQHRRSFAVVVGNECVLREHGQSLTGLAVGWERVQPDELDGLTRRQRDDGGRVEIDDLDAIVIGGWLSPHRCSDGVLGEG